MKNFINILRKDTSTLFGLTLLCASALLYLCTFSQFEHHRDAFTPIFFIHYGMAIMYLVYLIVNSKLKLFRLFTGPSKPYHIILLLLLNVSAYSLNQTISVFHESVDWVAAFLVIENILLLVYILYPTDNKYFNALLLFAFTLAIIFNGYQLMMIFPYMAIGFIASPFLGISLHVLVPVGFVVALLFILSDLIKKGTGWIPFAIAVCGCFLLLGYYVVQWNNINKQISTTTHQQHVPGFTDELPTWIRLAQTLPNTEITKKALQTGLVYQEFREWDGFLGSGLRFEDTKRHDPFVSIASLVAGKVELDQTTKIKILDAQYNMRHESADRFWSGLNLKTRDVITNVELFPAYRLAYTEMVLYIKNNSDNKSGRWFNQEEALYTFQLPEGAAVSSLSLWIGDKEAKARLTTKSKAENAYNTIVGREVRDPSVVYWMEGNNIRVRVFPCTPEEDRQFKIGITSPLLHHNGTLSYSSIPFKGPDFSAANGSINVLLQNGDQNLKSRIAFEKTGRTYSWTGSYSGDWNISVKAPKLATQPFYYKENAYHISKFSPKYSPFNPGKIYIDLHKGWTTADIRGLAAIFPEKTFAVYNYYSGMFESQSADKISELLNNDGAIPQFSLFPFHKVQSPAQALVIAKGNQVSPNLSDLTGTDFHEALFNFFASSRPVKVFDLNNQPSDYMQSLKEFQVIQYSHGTTGHLKQYVENGKFPLIVQRPDAVTLLPAGIVVSKTPGEGTATNAPDHLLRLFSYNQVLKSIGKNYFKNDYLEEEIIKEATLGNVVTPISSLIVLETLHDYERFGIDENKDSLGNADINASGAVPEPHEWALIILGLLFLTWMWFFKGKKSFTI